MLDFAYMWIFQIYKTMHTPEPAQKTLYKSQSEEKCAYVHLHPDSSPKSPYMELTMPSFTMNKSAYHSHAYSHPRDTCLTPSKVQDIKEIWDPDCNSIWAIAYN